MYSCTLTGPVDARMISAVLRRARYTLRTPSPSANFQIQLRGLVAARGMSSEERAAQAAAA
jgi:hypothetical protein